MSSNQNSKMKTNGIVKCWEQMEELVHPYIAGENMKCYNYSGKQFGKLLYIKQFSIFSPRYVSRQIKDYVYKHILLPMLIACP